MVTCLPGLDLVCSISRFVSIGVASITVLGVDVPQDGDRGSGLLGLQAVQGQLKVEKVVAPSALPLGKGH